MRRSLTERGARTTIKAIASRVGDRWFDLRHGTDTAGRTELAALNIPSENKSRGVDYTPTHAGAFLKLIGSLTLPSDSVLVDLGCGKGKILLLACYHPFKRIVGVEFSPELCSVARRNITRFGERAAIATPIDVVEQDAVDYAIEDDQNVFCLFNPFDAIVMGQVMTNLRASLARRQRGIWIVYNNPVFRGVILRSGEFLEIGAYDHGSSRFGVFANRPRDDSGPTPGGVEPERRPRRF